MHLVHKLIEIILMSCAQVDKGLDSLIWVRRNVLALSGSYYGNGVVGKGSEVGNGGIDICGFVDANKRFVENGEEIPEEMEGYRLFGEVRLVDVVES